MKTKFLVLLIISALVLSCTFENRRNQKDEPGWYDEIIYHVMPRSFYDSNGDLHGDLKGFVEKLTYLQELGVTTILFTPLYESGFYHNYFPTNYQNIDPEYGTMDDYLFFIKEVHKRGMKFLMDMETQYAQSGNIWFDDSYQNPESEYSEFIYYPDSANLYPEQIFMPSRSPLYEFEAWPGDKYNIVFLGLNSPVVKQWMKNFYAFWVDPDKDGIFDDGVDGFRIDHIMDDLDYKGLFTNMYHDFWGPIFSHCKKINPEIFILGEQSNWNEYGEKMVKESGADAAFSFPLRFAISGVEGTHDMYAEDKNNGLQINPERIGEIVKETIIRFSNNTFSINFLENHDTQRWATVVNENKGIVRIGAVLNLLLPGVPSIYYGQELGLTGTPGDWGSDANHIPVREAFPWTAGFNDKGNAVWYKDTGPWWDQSLFLSDKIKDLTLSAQQPDPESLWNLYRKLIQIRKSGNAIKYGDFKYEIQKDSSIMLFTRNLTDEKIMVILNTSGDQKTVIKPICNEILYKENINLVAEELQIKPYGFIILKTN